MRNFFSEKKNLLIKIVPIVLIILSIPVAVALIKEQQKLKSKANVEAINFVGPENDIRRITGNPVPNLFFDSANPSVTPRVEIEINAPNPPGTAAQVLISPSPTGGAVTSQPSQATNTPSPTASSTQATNTPSPAPTIGSPGGGTPLPLVPSLTPTP